MAFDVPPGWVAPATLHHLTMVVPPQFNNAINRHDQHLIDLSAALMAAGVTSTMASLFVAAAHASFRDGLVALIAALEGVCDEHD